MLNKRFFFIVIISTVLSAICFFSCTEGTGDNVNEVREEYPEVTVDDIEAIIEESRETFTKEGKLVYVLSSDYGGSKAKINFGKGDQLEFEVNDKILVDEMGSWIGRIVELDYYKTENEEARKLLLYKNYRAIDCKFVRR